MEIVLQTLKTRYAQFTGRAGRREYWMFILAYFLASLVAGVLDAILFHGSSLLQVLVGLGLIVPAVALGFRRLHDIDKSAWWMLIGLVPFFGVVTLIVFHCLPGTVGTNRFGADPRDVAPSLGMAEA